MKDLVIPKYMKNKLDRIIRNRIQAKTLEREFYDWLEEKDVDVCSSNFMCSVMVQLIYVECICSAKDVELMLNECIKADKDGVQYGDG